MSTRIPRISRALVLALLVAEACAPSDDRTAGAPGPMATLASDSALVMDGLRFLASDSLRGRATGTPGAATARAYLARKLEEAGVSPVGSGFMHPFTWSRQDDTLTRSGVNVVGRVRGSVLPDRYIVVSAHYDHVGVRGGEIYNGADDDASGSMGLVALARAVRNQPLRHSLLFVAFDAEEVGLRGSRAFVSDPPVPLGAIALDLNMDMVARTGGVLWAAGAHQTPALRPILEDVAARAPLDFRLGHDAPGAPEGDDWTQSSDQGPFHLAGIPFVYLGVEDHPDYHRPTDDFDRIVPGDYMNALRTALMTLLALDRALPLPSDPTSTP